MGDNDLSRVITEVIARAPTLLRSELLLKHDGTRAAAEETLATMIATGIEKWVQASRKGSAMVISH